MSKLQETMIAEIRNDFEKSSAIDYTTYLENQLVHFKVYSKTLSDELNELKEEEIEEYDDDRLRKQVIYQSHPDEKIF